METGYVFIGSHQGPYGAVGPSAEIPAKTSGFHPRVYKSNPQDAKARNIYEATMAARREQIKQLVLQLRDQGDEYLEDEAKILEDDLQRLAGH